MPTSPQPRSGDWGWRRRIRATTTEAAAYLEEAITLFQSLDDQLLAAAVRHALGVVHYEQNDLRRVDCSFTDALAEFRTYDQPWLMGYALASLGKIARAQGDYARRGRSMPKV